MDLRLRSLTLARRSDAMESKVIKSDFRGLNNFVKCLTGGYNVKVGIMGAKNARDDGQTNADIGVIHEFGRPATRSSKAIPMRSFLWMPIMTMANRIVNETKEDSMLKKILLDQMPAVMKSLGIACERAIAEAFASAGFGHWAPNTPFTIAQKSKKGKTSDSPLIDTGQLRRSISSEVVRR